MKKLIPILLALCIVFSCVPLTVFAEDTPEDATAGSHKDLDDNALSFSCTYNADTGVINVAGTVNHDIMVMHNNYTLEVYAVLPGEDTENVVGAEDREPLATALISIKFQFSLTIKETIEKYSRYALALRSPEGEVLLHTDAKYPEIPAQSGREESAYRYKGVESSLTSSAGNAYPGTALIEVDLSELISTGTGGLLYQNDGNHIYFDKAYVERTDARVRTFAASGTEVYFRLVVPEKAILSNLLPSEIMDLPEYDLGSEKGLTTLDTAISFLAERYQKESSREVVGFIIGRQADIPVTTGSVWLSLEDYADLYTLYVTIIARAARQKNPALDIVIPFSSRNDYAGSETAVTGGYSPAALLESLLDRFDSRIGGDFSVRTLIESDALPFDVDMPTERIDMTTVPDDGKLHADNLAVYESFLEKMREAYKSAPESFLFVWKPPADLCGNMLACVYAYSYYRLIGYEKISAFVVSLRNSEDAGIQTRFYDIRRIFNGIDTANSFTVTAPLLTYFGAGTWSGVLRGIDVNAGNMRNIYHMRYLQTLPSNIIGHFSYFDFSSPVNLDDWYQGVSCGGLKLDYTFLGKRALKMTLNEPAATGEYSEILCLYEYPENLIYTPYITMTMEIGLPEGQEESTDLYEIRIATGSGANSAVMSLVLTAGERTGISFDLSDFTKACYSDYWKISVRSLSGGSEAVSLWLYDITGHSTEYHSEELGKLIEQERLRIRNQSAGDDDGGDGNAALKIGFAIFAVVAVVGAGLFVALRQRENSLEAAQEADEKKKNEKKR